jgi:hypothetical protein
MLYAFCADRQPQTMVAINNKETAENALSSCEIQCETLRVQRVFYWTNTRQWFVCVWVWVKCGAQTANKEHSCFLLLRCVVNFRRPHVMRERRIHLRTASCILEISTRVHTHSFNSNLYLLPVRFWPFLLSGFFASWSSHGRPARS